ncbi:MAG: branched-chain amino acid transport system II carrier protein [Bacteroidales bacterium]|nr:branched-chain amino acid transport system II carrier protein [Bacteroidales bacterium]
MSKLKDIWIVGLALFAMMFGAGNLIFPPKLGLNLGEDWLTGILGFFTTDVGLSLLAIIAVALAGGSVTKIGDKVHPIFSKIIGLVIVLAIGPLLALPRTGAVTYEMGITPIFPNLSPLITSIIYFSITTWFVLNPGTVVDKIGKILTPILLITLFTIIIKGIFSPIAEIKNTGISHSFSKSFLEGYQTVDGIGAIIFAPIIISALVAKGYSTVKSQIRMTIFSGILAMTVIGIVYGGLIYIGAQFTEIYSADIKRTELFVGIVKNLLGNSGTIIMSICVIMACLTTAIGLAMTTGNYFKEISNGKLPYKWVAITTIIISFFIANLSVDTIVNISFPILTLVYPTVIVLIILNIFDRFTIGNWVYRCSVALTFIVEIPRTINSYGVDITYLKKHVNDLPLSENQLEWVLPSLVGIFIGYSIDIIMQYKTKILYMNKTEVYMKKTI